MTTKFSWRIVGFCGLLLLALILLQIALAEAAPARNDGFLYGKVTTSAGKAYTGFLRWGEEEAFWDDLFHSAKRDLEYFEEAERADQAGGGKDADEDAGGDRRARRDYERERRSKRSFDIFGKHIVVEGFENGAGSRIFIARFGDIARIRPRAGDRAEVEMKSGLKVRVEGYANDVGGIVTVHDEQLGEKNLSWERIEEIEFLPVPAGSDPGVTRLHGVVETDAGQFTGFIQWDKEECLSTDKLDAEDDEGKVSIPLGRVRAIERRGFSGSLVTLKDGESLRLRGTNDVDEDNRGVMVEDPRYGRVTIPWKEFDKVTFSDPAGSGPGYRDYPAGRQLSGTVRDAKGREHRGRIVFDLDESEDWEMLNGTYEGVECDIPFGMVRALEPQRADRTLATLRNGTELLLEDSQDVTASNDGVLIYTGGKKPVYVAWEDVEEIRFEP